MFGTILIYFLILSYNIKTVRYQRGIWTELRWMSKARNKIIWVLIRMRSYFLFYILFEECNWYSISLFLLKDFHFFWNLFRLLILIFITIRLLLLLILVYSFWCCNNWKTFRVHKQRCWSAFNHTLLFYFLCLPIAPLPPLHSHHWHTKTASTIDVQLVEIYYCWSQTQIWCGPRWPVQSVVHIWDMYLTMGQNLQGSDFASTRHP